ncbi:sufE-like protein 2, chloroplastic [Cornus florida]|uniref:sufE-like protein 2, chloroplastic n=1 Tax=Cornus florida TaxID=4283 RepID=UPI00289AE179|nr:sufE-like protein 2, chloroplastic [Cornus florida]
MHSTALKTLPPPPFSSFSRISIFRNPNPSSIQYSKHKKEKQRESISKSIKCICVSDSNINSYYFHPLKPVNPSSSVSDKVRSLVSEFESLSEPIDRVKRLLHYADLLPPLDESGRVQSNRITGCTVQVWLEAKMLGNGTMRFGADSDSEIAKGFCSCLVWMMDGAAPEEVLEVKTEDLAELNMGLSGRAHSRVNTWNSILIGMQKRTKALVEERQGKVLKV